MVLGYLEPDTGWCGLGNSWRGSAQLASNKAQNACLPKKHQRLSELQHGVKLSTDKNDQIAPYSTSNALLVTSEKKMSQRMRLYKDTTRKTSPMHTTTF